MLRTEHQGLLFALEIEEARAFDESLAVVAVDWSKCYQAYCRGLQYDGRSRPGRAKLALPVMFLGVRGCGDSWVDVDGALLGRKRNPFRATSWEVGPVKCLRTLRAF